jgi:hypothetical protein
VIWLISYEYIAPDDWRESDCAAGNENYRWRMRYETEEEVAEVAAGKCCEASSEADCCGNRKRTQRGQLG